jgi:hypothetical protein
MEHPVLPLEFPAQPIKATAEGAAADVAQVRVPVVLVEQADLVMWLFILVATDLK